MLFQHFADLLAKLGDGEILLVVLDFQHFAKLLLLLKVDEKHDDVLELVQRRAIEACTVSAFKRKERERKP